MDSSAQIMWGMLFGAIGLGFFIYGKRQRAIVPFVVGVTLFIFPYFISNVYLLVLVGVVLVAIPYFIRI
jgi:predicted membrane protein